MNKHINKKIVEVLTKNFIHRNFNNKENGILRPIAIQHIELCYDIIINNEINSYFDFLTIRTVLVFQPVRNSVFRKVRLCGLSVSKDSG